MASRYFNQFPGSFRFGLKLIEGAALVGASGAVTAKSFTGGGLSGSSTVTLQNLTTGIYRLQLADPYYRLVHAEIDLIAPTSGTVEVDGQLVVGKPYQILGGTSAVVSVANQPTTSTNYYTLGLYPGLNPTAGQVFVATSGASLVPASSTSLVGQGQFNRVLNTGISHVEILPGVNTTLAPTSASSGVQGAIIQFQTLGATGTSATTLIPTNPTTNTWIRWNLWLDNSNRVLFNEASTSN